MAENPPETLTISEAVKLFQNFDASNPPPLDRAVAAAKEAPGKVFEEDIFNKYRTLPDDYKIAILKAALIKAPVIAGAFFANHPEEIKDQAILTNLIENSNAVIVIANYLIYKLENYGPAMVLKAAGKEPMYAIEYFTGPAHVNEPNALAVIQYSVKQLSGLDNLRAAKEKIDETKYKDDPKIKEALKDVQEEPASVQQEPLAETKTPASPEIPSDMDMYDLLDKEWEKYKNSPNLRGFFMDKAKGENATRVLNVLHFSNLRQKLPTGLADEVIQAALEKCSQEDRNIVFALQFYKDVPEYKEKSYAATMIETMVSKAAEVDPSVIIGYFEAFKETTYAEEKLKSACENIIRGNSIYEWINLIEGSYYFYDKFSWWPDMLKQVVIKFKSQQLEKFNDSVKYYRKESRDKNSHEDSRKNYKALLDRIRAAEKASGSAVGVSGAPAIAPSASPARAPAPAAPPAAAPAARSAAAHVERDSRPVDFKASRDKFKAKLESENNLAAEIAKINDSAGNAYSHEIEEGDNLSKILLNYIKQCGAGCGNKIALTYIALGNLEEAGMNVNFVKIGHTIKIQDKKLTIKDRDGNAVTLKGKLIENLPLFNVSSVVSVGRSAPPNITGTAAGKIEMQQPLEGQELHEKLCEENEALINEFLGLGGIKDDLYWSEDYKFGLELEDNANFKGFETGPGEILNGWAQYRLIIDPSRIHGLDRIITAENTILREGIARLKSALPYEMKIITRVGADREDASKKVKRLEKRLGAINEKVLEKEQLLKQQNEELARLYASSPSKTAERQLRKEHFASLEKSAKEYEYEFLTPYTLEQAIWGLLEGCWRENVIPPISLDQLGGKFLNRKEKISVEEATQAFRDWAEKYKVPSLQSAISNKRRDMIMWSRQGLIDDVKKYDYDFAGTGKANVEAGEQLVDELLKKCLKSNVWPPDSLEKLGGEFAKRESNFDYPKDKTEVNRAIQNWIDKQLAKVSQMRTEIQKTEKEIKGLKEQNQPKIDAIKEQIRFYRANIIGVLSDFKYTIRVNDPKDESKGYILSYSDGEQTHDVVVAGNLEKLKGNIYYFDNYYYLRILPDDRVEIRCASRWDSGRLAFVDRDEKRYIYKLNQLPPDEKRGLLNSEKLVELRDGKYNYEDSQATSTLSRGENADIKRIGEILADTIGSDVDYYEKAAVILFAFIKGPDRFLYEDGEKYWRAGKREIEKVFKTPAQKRKLVIALGHALDSTAPGKIDFNAELKDEYGYKIFVNEEYEKNWNGIQKFCYRREKQLPGFTEWFRKKMSAYKEELEGRR